MGHAPEEPMLFEETISEVLITVLAPSLFLNTWPWREGAIKVMHLSHTMKNKEVLSENFSVLWMQKLSEK